MRRKTKFENKLAVTGSVTIWFIRCLSVLLGVIFLYAGLSKVFTPAILTETVANYKIPPFDQAPFDMWLGYFLPMIEVLVGLGLLLFIWHRGAVLLSGMMSFVFLIGIISVWIRGLDIHCGCFGDEEVFDGYLIHVIFLLGMILASSYLWVKRGVGASCAAA